MKFTKEQTKFMQTALELAAKGAGSVFPNPMVGCVIVKNGKVIAKGSHKIFGGLHAEANALNAAAAKASGAEMYVTLEPCNHHGKRPPCTQHIINAKIKKVFVASVDPNFKVKNQGIGRLRAAGIEVETGLLAKEEQRLNAAYRKHITAAARPYCALKTAMSLDGKIATREYDSKWITSPKSREYVHKLRTRFDAILVGSNTVIKDNPSLTSHGKGKNPVRIIIDQKLKTPAKHNVLDAKVPTVIAYDAQIKTAPPYMQKEGIVLLPLDFNAFRKDFKVLTKKLNDYGLKTILIEGGGETAASALFSGAVNEVYSFIAPIIVGGRAAVSPVEGVGAAKIKNALKLKNTQVTKIGADLLVRGAL